MTPAGVKEVMMYDTCRRQVCQYDETCRSQVSQCMTPAGVKYLNV